MKQEAKDKILKVVSEQLDKVNPDALFDITVTQTVDGEHYNSTKIEFVQMVDGTYEVESVEES